MDTTIYYTFSTISQTLAGAIGLLGAFVLYRLQNLGHELEDLGITLINCYQPSAARSALEEIIHKACYDEVLAFTAQNEFTDPSAKSTYVASKVARFPQLLRVRKSVHYWLNLSLVLTVGLISGSVGVLALAPRVVANPPLPAISLLVGWIWLVACFVAYAKLLGATLEREQPGR